MYDLSEPFPERRRFIPNAADGGRDLNAQICPFPDGRHILLGEDSNQTAGVPQGWGVIDITTRVQVGKLVATYGPTPQPENYGCAIEDDGHGRVTRIFVGQTGAGTFDAKDGQVIEFFPDSPALDAVFGRRTPDQVCPAGNCEALTKNDSNWCILDGDLATAGGFALDKGDLLVTETSPQVPQLGRVLRYRKPFPSTAAACAAKTPETFLQDIHATTPAAIVAARDRQGKQTGHWYVSSVLFPQAVAEYDANAKFVRYVVPPVLWGTPFGLGVDRHGTLYAADLGVTIDPAGLASGGGSFGIGPGDGEGSVLRVRLSSRGRPRRPEVLADGLTFPDGIGIVEVPPGR